MDSCRRHSPLREMMTTAANRNIRPLNSILNLHCFMRCHTSSLLIVLLSQLWHNSGSPLRRPATAWARCPSQSRPASSLPHLRARTPSHQTITWRAQGCCTALNCCSDCYLDGWLAGSPTCASFSTPGQLYFLPLEGSISVLMPCLCIVYNSPFFHFP